MLSKARTISNQLFYFYRETLRKCIFKHINKYIFKKPFYYILNLTVLIFRLIQSGSNCYMRLTLSTVIHSEFGFSRIRQWISSVNQSQSVCEYVCVCHISGSLVVFRTYQKVKAAALKSV